MKHPCYSWLAVLAVCAMHQDVVLGQNVEPGETVGDASPYRVRIELVVKAPHAMRQYIERSTSSRLPRRLEDALGETGNVRVDLEIVRSFGIVSTSTGIGIQPTSPAAEAIADIDKVLHLRIEDTRRGFEIAAQDYDVSTRYLCPPAHLEVRQASRLIEGGLAALMAAFSPIAEFQQVPDDPDHVLVRERWPVSRDAGLAATLVEGDILVPVLRRNEPGSQSRVAETQVVPWTFLVVERTDGVAPPAVDSPEDDRPPVDDGTTPIEHEHNILCRVESHSRRSLGVRRRGQVEQLAIRVRPQAAPVTLRLFTQSEPRRPLVGCNIYSRESDAGDVVDAAAVGVSDLSGEVRISPSDQPLQLLWIKSGELLLAKVPIVCGLADVLEIPLSEDPARIRAAGDLQALRTELVDLVARRNILLARARAAVADGDLALARSLARELDKLPTRAQFNQRIDSVVLVATSPDRVSQSRIDRLVQETRSVLGEYLDPREISNLHSEITNAEK